MKQILLLLCSILIWGAARSQTVGGMWYAIGNVDAGGEHSNYLTELILTQNGSNVTGQFNYFFKEQYFEYKIKGKFDSKTRKLIFSSVPIVNYRSVTAAMGIECTMTGSFTLITSKAETALTGKLLPSEDYKYTCPPINFKFKHPSKDKPVFEMPEPDTDISDTKALADIMIEKMAQAKKRTDSIKAILPEISKPKPIDTIVPNVVKAFSTRTIVEEKYIEVTNDTLRFELYDNGEIDGDTVSLFFNKQILVNKRELGRKPITVIVSIDTVHVNELSLFAESLGTIPPNTAYIIMFDGNSQTTFTVSSTLTTNGTVRIKKRKAADSRLIQ